VKRIAIIVSLVAAATACQRADDGKRKDQGQEQDKVPTPEPGAKGEGAGGGAVAPGAEKSVCARFVERALELELSNPAIDPETREMLESGRAELVAQTTAQCERNPMPEEVMTCVIGAADYPAYSACMDKLTQRPKKEPRPGTRPPTADDLAAYTGDLKGKGPLTATIVTNHGTIRCELAEDKAPMTVANFIGLARGKHPWWDGKAEEAVTRPYYDGLTFHRVIPGFMIQGGDPDGVGSGGPGYEFDDEIHPDLRHDRAGVMSMANAGKGTNGSQFFITDGAPAHLDGRHTVFGHCKDTAVVKKIAGVATGPNDRPAKPVVMKKVTIQRGK
jgi:peptidyl-prolyl cis-trans isomerase A (cyclophilin A)